MALEITDQNLNEVLNTDKPVIIDFWAVWCGPCKIIAPIIDEMADEYADRAVVGKVNVDENMEVSSKYGIRNIPTVFFVKNGEVVDKVVGVVPKATLVSKLEALL